MSIKERPLIKAVERLGPLPGFLFAHPIVAGFFAMVMMFWGAFGTTSEVYQAMRLGALVLTAFGAMVFLSIFCSALFTPDEFAYRIQFVLGGVSGLAFIIAFDWLTADYLREYFGGSFLICTSQSANCY